MGQCPYFAPLSVPVSRNREAPITRKPLAPVMMNFKQLPWIPVGADLSALGGCSLSRSKSENSSSPLLKVYLSVLTCTMKKTHMSPTTCSLHPVPRRLDVLSACFLLMRFLLSCNDEVPHKKVAMAARKAIRKVMPQAVPNRKSRLRTGPKIVPRSSPRIRMKSRNSSTLWHVLVCRNRNDAKLLHHTQIIAYRSMLYPLAISEAHEMHLGLPN